MFPMASSSSQRLIASSLVKHIFRKRCLRRQTDETTTLNGQLATMAMQCRLLLLAYAIDHEETFMPFKMGIDIIVRFLFDPFRFERATVWYDAL